ncbi:MAG TPA: TlpA disulfide reductase family protein [Burkholderiales bacterium]|jgi:thiol-disulfide isomerase/thioredoxin|nr:TlpA disulfide reductase family protein [Burkholderiales bacterium]
MKDSRRRWLAMAGVGALAAAAGYGVHLWWADGQADVPNAAAVEALLTAPLKDLEGGSKAIESWRGKVLVINFWATWCVPCRKEIPEFVKMQESHGVRGLQFVGIAFDQPQPVGDFARELGINYPLLMGGLDTMALMRESGNKAGVLPFTLVLDRKGKVARTHRGVLTEAALEGIVRALL